MTVEIILFYPKYADEIIGAVVVKLFSAEVTHLANIQSQDSQT
jgi:hypothetical protein